jgi:hydroxyacylglutathione hydrolase
MQIYPVRCLRDNFAYLVSDGTSEDAAVVDPGEAQPVLDALERRGLVLRQIWATHHHPDHVGGAKALSARFPGLELVAHKDDADKVARFSPVTRVVDEGDEVALGGLRARVLHNPGHTLGAISYLVHNADASVAAASSPSAGAEEDKPALFTGDTLFSAGCGRLFEGDAAMMYASLCKLAALPEETRVYFGHEYTQANLRFALAVTPDDARVQRAKREVDELLAIDAPTTPSSIGLERAVNPFLRCTEPALIAAARQRGAAADSPAAVFAALRAWKDAF